jgi:hypothetical protein
MGSDSKVNTNRAKVTVDLIGESTGVIETAMESVVTSDHVGETGSL